MPSHRPTSVRAASASGDPAARLGDDRLDPGRARVRGRARAPQDHVTPDLGLPAAAGAAAAGDPVGIDRHVPDLAGQAGAPQERQAAHDRAAADAHLARDVEGIVHVDGGPAPMLGEHPGIGVVEDRDRKVEIEGAGEPVAERDVDPAEVRGHEHEAVGPPDDPGDRHPDPHDRAHRRNVQVPGEADEAVHDVVHGHVVERSFDADAIERPAAEPDDGRGHRADQDLEREHDRAGRLRPDEGRGPARRPEADRVALGHEARGGQLVHEVADRAAGQAGGGDELGAGARAVLMEDPEDGAEVRPMDRLAALARVDGTDPHDL